MNIIKAFERQKDIYLKGISGWKSPIPFNSSELRTLAKKHMSETAWAYIDGGASDEESIQRNRDAFNNYPIVQRFMRDSSQADFSSTIFNTRLPFPLLVAPIGALDMIYKNADLEVAKGAAKAETPYIFSNQGGNSMEACAGVMGNTDRWFQLYWSKSDDLVLSFVRRAEKAGCKAIVLTVDTTMLGWRSRDLSFSYLPFLKGYGIAQYTSDPVFNDYVQNGWDGASMANVKPKFNIHTIKHLLELKSNYKGSFKDALKSAQLFTQIYTNPQLSWDNVKWLKTQTHLPLIIKGILHPDDAKAAQQAGADGIVVSNHGGRQVNGCVSSIEMLPFIREALPQPFKIFIDSGIRNGSDVFKAIALGADAVLLGRPYAYGLAIGKAKGVETVIRNIQNDFELTARLSGCRNLGEITKDNLKLK